MNSRQIAEALQDLIIRLQDSEKGYREIEKAISNKPLKKWMLRYADERHNMHRKLETLVNNLGEDAEVKTSFLGDLHRMFIDLKLNNTEEDFVSIANEIERGSGVLIDDYKTVLKEVEMPATYVTTLRSQLATIEVEIEEIKKLKEEIETVETY